jgi:glycosyltransferase involved in cell wall biosynthesis
VQHGTFARAAVRIDKERFFFKYLMKFYVWATFEGLAARRATQCVAVSNETKESVEMYYHAKNVRVIPNAVDTDFFQPTGIQKKNQAIFVGRFELAKGKEILEGMKNYLELCGWNVLVAEKLSQKELAVAYNESKVFLLPSLHEGCSYALLDAMSCGLPFLASPVGLVSDFVEQKLFPECVVSVQTLESYQESFKKLIELSDDELEDLTVRLRNYILQSHSINYFNDAYLLLIKELL